MTEQATKAPEETKKNPLQKLKEGLDDKEEQAVVITTLIKIVVLGWSGAILTLNYVSIPGIPQQKIDPTFIASVFVGLASSFGASITQKGGGEKAKNGKSTADELKEILGNTQIVRIETPVKLVPQEPRIDPITNKIVDPQSGRLTE